MHRDPASFRDPGGHVYLTKEKVIRSVMPSAKADFDFCQQTGLYQLLIGSHDLLPMHEIQDRSPYPELDDASLLLEHPKLSFISYPYEWSFSALKAAALLHLKIAKIALEHDVMLNDASAYNIQFIGTQPIFIDHLAFRAYKKGEYWTAQKQFCEQFLNPLLLYSYCHTPFQDFYRGRLSGISSEIVNHCLPWYRKLSPTVFNYVCLQHRFSKQSQTKAVSCLARKPLKKSALAYFFTHLENFITKLKPSTKIFSPWQDYQRDCHYSSAAMNDKAAFIKDFVSTHDVSNLWDLGGHQGEYAMHALDAGATQIIGFDNDIVNVDAAFLQYKNQAGYLPLYMDLLNPSPMQGWQQQERAGLQQRSSPDAIIALALIHHLSIAANVPLDKVIDFLISLAPMGIIEFIPKADPKVQALLALREDIFTEYDIETCRASILARAEIISEKVLAGSQRVLISYQRQS